MSYFKRFYPHLSNKFELEISLGDIGTLCWFMGILGIFFALAAFFIGIDTSTGKLIENDILKYLFLFIDIFFSIIYIWLSFKIKAKKYYFVPYICIWVIIDSLFKIFNGKYAIMSAIIILYCLTGLRSYFAYKKITNV